MLSYMISLLSGLAVLTAASPLLQPRQSLVSSPGSIACTNLTQSLGVLKIGDPLSLEYVVSKNEYWNTVQATYNPSCVVYPKTAQDVSTALKAIKAAKSRFAVKTQGHNPNTFFSSVDQGVLIDLNSMTQKSYQESTGLGSYQPGGSFGDVYEYFAPYGVTVVGARLAGVGTGLALGGGLSYLSSQYGMACDSFRQLEVVLPSGEIVTASPTENTDLFFADRGGGGNAYGIVTNYTVQTRPSGTFFAGNIIYLANQTNAVMSAITNFIQYNTDPKAAIIVYDGPDAGNTFDNFTSIPNFLNTLGKKSYLEVVNMPIPFATELSAGHNIFRNAVHRVGDGHYKEAFTAWSQWCANNQGNYSLSSIDFQPIPKSLTDASNAQNGGNAMQMPSGPWLWLNFLISTPPTLTAAQYDAVQASFRDMVASVPNAPGLPMFINDANYDQNPLSTFSTYQRLQAIKKKYDPEGFFAQYTGGWNFNA